MEEDRSHNRSGNATPWRSTGRRVRQPQQGGAQLRHPDAVVGHEGGLANSLVERTPTVPVRGHVALLDGGRGGVRLLVRESRAEPSQRPGNRRGQGRGHRAAPQRRDEAGAVDAATRSGVAERRTRRIDAEQGHGRVVGVPGGGRRHVYAVDVQKALRVERSRSFVYAQKVPNTPIGTETRNTSRHSTEASTHR